VLSAYFAIAGSTLATTSCGSAHLVSPNTLY